MSTFSQNFDQDFYIVVQICTPNTLSSQTNYILPYEDAVFDSIDNNDGLLLQSINVTNASNVVLFQIESQDLPSQVYSQLVSLSYKSISFEQMQFVVNSWFNDIDFPLRVWQLTKSQLQTITANSSNETISSLNDVVNPNVINTLTRQPVVVSQLQIGSFRIPFSALGAYFGLGLYGSETPPPVPSPINFPTLVLGSVTDTSVTFYVENSNVYQRLQVITFGSTTGGQGGINVGTRVDSLQNAIITPNLGYSVTYLYSSNPAFFVAGTTRYILSVFQVFGTTDQSGFSDPLEFDIPSPPTPPPLVVPNVPDVPELLLPA